MRMYVCDCQQRAVVRGVQSYSVESTLFVPRLPWALELAAAHYAPENSSAGEGNPGKQGSSDYESDRANVNSHAELLSFLHLHLIRCTIRASSVGKTRVVHIFNKKERKPESPS